MNEHYTVYTDAVGHVLRVGQTVVYCVAGTSKVMKSAKIVRLLPKTVELDAQREPYQKPLRREHSAVAVVRDSE